MIGKLQNTITIKQLYEYAQQHNYIDTDAIFVLDIINRERNSVGSEINNTLVTPINNTSTINFDTLVEFTYEDVINLLST